ncbi:MAG: porin family protein [Fluviicola sp.]
MKKILTVAVAIMTFSTVFSQVEPGTPTSTFSIGPSMGFGHTGIRNTSGTDFFKANWSAGVIINYSNMKHTGFAAEVLWSLEGAKVKNAIYETSLTMQYIRVPLRFAYYFGDIDNVFRPKITIGPSMGFLLDATSDSNAPGTSRSDVTTSYNRFDIGGMASVGFNLKLAQNIWLNTDFNYYTGFRPIRTNQYNSNFGMRMGLAFGL